MKKLSAQITTTAVKIYLKNSISLILIPKSSETNLTRTWVNGW